MNIKRTALNITTFCNLKCRHCLAFIPYYDEKFSMNIEDAKIVLKNYFEVVDTVERFTVTGGEPLLNTDCYAILKEVFKFEKQIKYSVDFVTNGTMYIPSEILELFASNKNKVKVVLSDYGESLSKNIEQIQDDLQKYDISYRISKFYGDDLYYDGWIDFTDHSLKWNTIEERDCNAQKCVHAVGKYFVINNGELHRCSRSFWRMHKNIIPKVEGEYVPLVDQSISLDRKREILEGMYNMKSGTSCAYCVGLCNDVPRVRPAQQL